MASIQDRTIDQFPFRVTIGTRHTDLDIHKNINNVAVAEIFEEARTLYSLSRKLKPAFDPHRRYLESLTILFGEDGSYPASFDVGVAVASVAPDSWTLRLLAVQGEKKIAGCDCVFGLVSDEGRVDLPAALADILRQDMLPGA